MTFLERIGLTSPPVKKEFVPHQKREKQGTTEYKNGSMYLYCSAEDKRLAKLLAIEHGISMKELVHRMLAVATVNKAKIFADPDAGKVRVVQPLMPKSGEPTAVEYTCTTMTISEFFEKFMDEPIRRYRAMVDAGDKK
jgi:hypothetical protein